MLASVAFEQCLLAGCFMPCVMVLLWQSLTNYVCLFNVTFL